MSRGGQLTDRRKRSKHQPPRAERGRGPAPKRTEKRVAALGCPAGRKDRLVFDDAVPGLAVRVAAGGGKTFLAQYTQAGRKRRVPLGRWGAVTLEQARAARGVLGDVA